MTARDDILAAIRGAAGTAAPIVRDYARTHALSGEALLARFVDRLGHYRVTVLHATPAELPAIAAAQLAARGVGSLVVPADLPVECRPAMPVPIEDRALSAASLDAAGGVMTLCFCAIAETGTIVLDAGVGQGRRAVSLLPDYHLCVVRADQVLGTVPEAIAAIAPSVAAGRPITFVSGPSATADIELERVPGVHGPRTLDVILVGG